MEQFKAEMETENKLDLEKEETYVQKNETKKSNQQPQRQNMHCARIFH